MKRMITSITMVTAMAFLVSGTSFAASTGKEGTIPVQVAKSSADQPDAHSGRLWSDEDQWMGRFGWGWDPFEEMDRMHSRIRRLMEDSFFGVPQTPSAVGPVYQRQSLFSPSMNIAESPAEYVVTVDVPGIPKENLEVELKGGLLQVTGRREAIDEKSQEQENFRYRLREASYGEFQRTVQLPADADRGSVNAEHKDGVLTIRIPRLEPHESESIKVDVR